MQISNFGLIDSVISIIALIVVILSNASVRAIT